jgi:hypothetical protein
MEDRKSNTMVLNIFPGDKKFYFNFKFFTEDKEVQVLF